jgi:hypothetical protein
VPTGYLIAGTPYILYYEAGVGEFIVLNANAAVLATTGTFSSTLGVTGAATFSSTIAVTGVSTFSDDLRAADGNATTPSYGFTNDTDCGWYRIGANNLGLALNGSKVLDAATTGLTVVGTLACDTLTVSTTFSNAAAQADQEAASSAGKLVTPSVQHFHPSASKCWLKCDNAGNVNASYNITSITDTGTGQVTVTVATDFSSAHYALLVSGGTDILYSAPSSSQAAGSFVIRGVNPGTGNVQDSTLGYYAVCFGDI